LITAALTGVLLALAGAGAYHLWQVLQIGTAYTAKVLCSGVFLAHRDPEAIRREDLAVDDLAPLRHVHAEIDREAGRVTASFLGLVRRQAVFRPGLGCTLAIGVPAAAIRSPGPPRDTRAAENAEAAWPEGERADRADLPPEVDLARLDAAVGLAFEEPDPARPRRTRAVVVAYQGRLVAERYAPGFSHATPLPGWSMTKAVVNALAGILVRDGRVSLESQGLLPEWRGPDDPRSRITLDHLLRMTSGLRFREDYTALRDVLYMLLATGDSAGYALRMPLDAPPGTRWQYASGTTNILARVLRDILEGGNGDYLGFPRRALFERIGMQSAVIEPDASGTFVGSSFMYASARDWARLGQLYLQDGIWRGEPILPEGWVGYTRTPTAQAPADKYGAHFWLQLPAEYCPDPKAPALPSDAFHAIGHEGQFVTVIPSRQLVVVRLGLTRLPGAWDHVAFLVRVLSALPG
jgi:hypothetical protein